MYIQLLRECFRELITDQETTEGMCINLFETTQHNNGLKGTTSLLNVSETCFFNREPDVEAKQHPPGLRNEANAEVPALHFLK